MTRISTGLGRVAVRLAIVAGLAALSAMLLSGRFADVTWSDVRLHLAAVTLADATAVLALVAVALFAVAGQERAVLAHLAMDLPPSRLRLAAMTVAAVSQATGFGPAVGAVIRIRLLPGITLAQSVAVSASITVGFFVGLSVLLLLGSVLMPGHDTRGNAAGVLLAVLALAVFAAVAPGARVFGRRKPNLIVMGRFVGWLAVDLGALCAAFWLLLPGAPALEELAPVFLMALGAGMISGSPAGVGPFEATLALGLPQVDAGSLVAGLVLFRLFAFAVPAVIGGLVLIAALRHPPAPVILIQPLAPQHLSGAALARLPAAEAQLVHQGNLHLTAPRPGLLWLSGALPHSRVLLGDPLGVVGAASPALREVSRAAGAEGRIACLYKIGPRLAAAARRAGYHVMPVAREAVLDPVRFSTAGPAHAALRRKLGRARKAAVTAEPASRPPLHEMETVARAWTRSHGRERGFSMGVWNRSTITSQRVFTARGGDGRLLAFVSFHASPVEWVLDLTRCRPGIPDGTMYLLIQAALDQAAREGIRRLTLAAVPEPAFRRDHGVIARLRPGRRRLSGLLQFKAAFAPVWERRYIAAPGRAALALAAAEIGLAILFPLPAERPVRPVLAVSANIGGVRARLPGATIRLLRAARPAPPAEEQRAAA